MDIFRLKSWFLIVLWLFLDMIIRGLDLGGRG
jgi:hypothetical protein